MSGRLASLRDVAGQVSRETCDDLVTFEQQFLRWSARINLAARSTLDDLWSRHVLDSAQLWRIAPDATRWLDLGSGGGFPGAVIAILAKERADAHVDLVESNRKKAAFLRTVLAQLSAPATVHPVRIEDAAAHIGRPDIVTARALAPLSDLIRLAEPWLKAGSVGLFHKGRDYAQEIAESRYEWRFDLVEHVSRVDPDSRILEIRNPVRLMPTSGRP